MTVDVLDELQAAGEGEQGGRGSELTHDRLQRLGGGGSGRSGSWTFQEFRSTRRKTILKPETDHAEGRMTKKSNAKHPVPKQVRMGVQKRSYQPGRTELREEIDLRGFSWDEARKAFCRPFDFDSD